MTAVIKSFQYLTYTLLSVYRHMRKRDTKQSPVLVNEVITFSTLPSFERYKNKNSSRTIMGSLFHFSNLCTRRGVNGNDSYVLNFNFV